MNFSVGAVAFMVCFVVIMGSADATTPNKKNSRAPANAVPVRKVSFAKQPSMAPRQVTITEPSQVVDQVNEGAVQMSESMPAVPTMGARVMEHLRELLKQLMMKLAASLHSLLRRIPEQTRRDIVTGLGQVQTYLQSMFALESVESKNIPLESENSSESNEAKEIVSEDESDQGDQIHQEGDTQKANTVEESQEEGEQKEEKVETPQQPQPETKPLSKRARRRLRLAKREDNKP